MGHPRLLDLMSEQTSENIAAACQMVRGKPATRTPTGVTLHQTACWFGVAPFQLKASGGDEALARHRRALAVHAHITAFRSGKFVVAYDPHVYVNHGHQWNSTDVGIEHEGLYDANGEPMEMPDRVDVGAIIEAGRAALSWLVETCPTIRYVHAHRQAMREGRNRRPKAADPGARIFREVGVEHGVKKLGLVIEPDKALGIGLPLPKGWYA